MVSTVASPLGMGFGSPSTCGAFLFSLCVISSRFSGFPAQSRNMKKLFRVAKLPVVVTVCVHVRLNGFNFEVA